MRNPQFYVSGKRPMRTIHGSSIHEASAHIGSNWSLFSKSKIQWYNSCLVNLYWNVLQAPYSHAVIYRRKHVTQPLPVWVQYQYRKSVNLVIARVSMISLSIIQSPHSLLGCKISNLTKFSYQQTRCHAHHWTYFGISGGGGGGGGVFVFHEGRFQLPVPSLCW